MKKISMIFLFMILFINACSKTSNNIQSIKSDDLSSLTPQQIVTLYFQSWNNKQYDIMYSLISDGFKQIEPTAKTFEDFKSYMSKFFDTSAGVNVVSAKEAYKNEKEAGIDYKIEITNKDGTKKEFASTYTLKKRVSNASEPTRSQVTGWKLIHPYGQNIDTT